MSGQDFKKGDRVLVYAAKYYKCRGTVTEVRVSDPAGAVSVRLDGETAAVKLHGCDLEKTGSAAADVAEEERRAA